jgi:hypothetical protein
MRSFKEPLVGTLLCGGLTWVLWSMATDAQAGIHREHHGRRAAMRALLGWLAFTLVQRKEGGQAPPPSAP